MGAAVASADGVVAEVAADSGLLIGGLILGGEIALGLVVLAVAARLLGVTELDQARDQILGRLRVDRRSESPKS